MEAEERHTARPSAEVLYVAYGSNLDPARFACYVSGGRPAGSQRTYRGCSNPAPHGAPVPLRIPHQLLFAGHSPTWGGGAAFIDLAVGGWSYAVGYPLTLSQLRDVVAQENGGEAGDVSSLELPAPHGTVAVDTLGWYDTLVGLPDTGMLRAVTFTAARPPAPFPSAPSSAYAATIAAGLAAHHGLGLTEASQYVVGARRRTPNLNT